MEADVENCKNSNSSEKPRFAPVDVAFRSLRSMWQVGWKEH